MHVFLRANTNSPDLKQVVAFNALQSIGLLAAILALLPALFSCFIYRSKTWFCILVSCVVYSMSFLLLIGHQTGPKPPLPLCLIQASLIYAAPPLLSTSGMLLVAELYLRLSAVTLSREVDERFINRMILVAPGIHCLVFLVIMILGLSNLETIERHPTGMYCRLRQYLPVLITGAIVIFLLGLMVFFEIYTIVHLLRRRSSSKAVSLHAYDFPLKLFIRTSLYTLVGGLSIIMVYVLVDSMTNPTMLSLLAAIPLSVSLVVGTQADILHFYMFWKKQNKQQVRSPSPEPKTEM